MITQKPVKHSFATGLFVLLSHYAIARYPDLAPAIMAVLSGVISLVFHTTIANAEDGL